MPGSPRARGPALPVGRRAVRPPGVCACSRGDRELRAERPQVPLPAPGAVLTRSAQRAKPPSLCPSPRLPWAPCPCHGETRRTRCFYSRAPPPVPALLLRTAERGEACSSCCPTAACPSVPGGLRPTARHGCPTAGLLRHGCPAAGPDSRLPALAASPRCFTPAAAPGRRGHGSGRSPAAQAALWGSFDP